MGVGIGDVPRLDGLRMNFRDACRPGLLLQGPGGVPVLQRPAHGGSGRPPDQSIYADATDRIWSLPAEAPEWYTVKSNVLLRIRISSLAELFLEELSGEIRDLQAAVDAELAKD